MLMRSVRRSNKRIASPSSPESSFSLAHPQRQTPPRQNARRLPVLSSIAAPRTRSNRRRQRKKRRAPPAHRVVAVVARCVTRRPSSSMTRQTGTKCDSLFVYKSTHCPASMQQHAYLLAASLQIASGICQLPRGRGSHFLPAYFSNNLPPQNVSRPSTRRVYISLALEGSARRIA